MGMNPETNKLEPLQLKELQQALDRVEKKQSAAELAELGQLLRPDGTPVPKHWSLFIVDETYVINGYRFKCAYIGETSILFEPVGPIIVGEPEVRGPAVDE